MTDRELLELAAKAAGYKVQWSVMRGGWADGYECFRHENGLRFDSLTDDGDALRLAVDLQIKVSIGENSSWAESIHLTDEPDLFAEWFEGGCKYAATRRAITRAAAEIGRNMDANQ